jgi:hypothetical protein
VCRNGFLLQGRKEGFEPPDPTLMGSQVYPGWRFANSCATVSLRNHFVNDVRSGKGFDDFCQ